MYIALTLRSSETEAIHVITVHIDGNIVVLDDVFTAANRIECLGKDLDGLDTVWQREVRRLIDGYELHSMSVGDSVAVIDDDGEFIAEYYVSFDGWADKAHADTDTRFIV